MSLPENATTAVTVGTETAAPPSAETQAVQPTGAQPPSESAAPQDDGERLFTQADLERIIKERLARERQKFADYEQLRKRVEEAEQLSQALAEKERAILAQEMIASEAIVRADFFERAATAGCTDLRLAYLAAQADGLLGAYDAQSGKISAHDLEGLKKRYPGLFRATVATGSADGASKQPANVFDINKWIRGA